MTSSRFAHVAREVLLTSTAIVGVLCALFVALGFVLGVHPLLFRSGSMSPAIDTGDLAFSHSVSVADVKKDDIVSVIADSGERVTHRVVDISGTGNSRLLTLKGDANDVIDPHVYDADSVQRVFFNVPKVGYAVDWLSRTPGVYLVAAYVALMLLLIGRGAAGADGGRRRPLEDEVVPGELVGADADPTTDVAEPVTDAPLAPKRFRGRGLRGALASAGVLGLVLAAAVAWAMPTWAAWTDGVAVTGQSLTTGTWASTFSIVDLVEGGNYPTGNAGTGSWAKVCNSGKVCADVIDPDGTSTVRYVLEGTGATGAHFGKCWTGSAWVTTPSASCSITMTRATGTNFNGEWRGLDISRNDATNGMNVGSYRVTVTATDALANVRTLVVNFTTS